MIPVEIQVLRKMNDETLIHNAKTLVQKERDATLRVLHCLQEILRRRLHFEKGYGSIYDFCIQHLGYSAASAARRIQAARLLQEFPELEVKIESGKMSLSVAAQAQSFFYNESKTQALSLERKKEILVTLENKSTREAEKEFLKISPQAVPKEKVRQLTAECQELRVILDADLTHELAELKSLLSHQFPNANYQELIRQAAKIANQKLRVKKLGAEKNIGEEVKPVKDREEDPKPIKTSVLHRALTTKTRSRYIQIPIRREVWRRDQACCAYIDPKTQKRCGSKVRLEFDHIKPYAHGGQQTVENLRVVCRAHNTQAAIQKLGGDRMRQWGVHIAN